MSLWDIARLGMGKNGDSSLADSMDAVIKTYMKPYMSAMLVLLVLVIVTVILNCAIGGIGAYAAGMLGQIVMNGTAFIMYLNIKGKFHEIAESGYGFFSLGDYITFSGSSLVVWFALEIIAFALNVWGLLSGKKKKEMWIEREVFPDDIPQRNNYATGKDVVKSLNEEKEYFGAIVGLMGMYTAKAYELKKLELVNVAETGNLIVVQKESDAMGGLAQIYYIPQYSEYCVRPLQKLSVFMESGQPLGNVREYYLPRKTKIYFRNKSNLFELA